MAKTKKRDSPEAKRWLIVGAYQAGATEKHVARISGLSKTAVRNIILNYQRTGTPCMPKKIPNKIKQKLVVEYDENGEIIDTDDEVEEPTIKKKAIRKKQLVTTKDIINYAMDQMRITDNNHINVSTQNLLVEKEKSPTPPWHKYHQQHHQQQQQNNTQQQQHQSSSSEKRLQPLSKFDQDIRGYELWTHDDDMLLLNHVLHHLHGGGWNELEVRFEGRHSARLCYDRWKHLKSLLLKGITDKPHTPW
ncbi:hypothetical protein MFLAVUS_001421 [Mucor flavus]|uniref:Myb-like domain-containing protein n=1 Tax=Mucor flavus TaxID=439312 RepID=A0ABP9YMI1_9FUNG